MDSHDKVNMTGVRSIVQAFYVFPIASTFVFLVLGFYLGRGCGYEAGYHEGKEAAKRELDDNKDEDRRFPFFPIFRDDMEGYPGL